jgi:FolB domain-containing protein
MEAEVDKIFIKGLIARGIIGINDWERENPQEILINITLYTNISAAGKSDNIQDSVNYKTVAKKAIQHAESSHRLTVEALASDLADLCLQDPKVQKVCVSVEKPRAVRFSASVGVEIERERKE